MPWYVTQSSSARCQYRARCRSGMTQMLVEKIDHALTRIHRVRCRPGCDHVTLARVDNQLHWSIHAPQADEEFLRLRVGHRVVAFSGDDQQRRTNAIDAVI